MADWQAAITVCKPSNQAWVSTALAQACLLQTETGRTANSAMKLLANWTKGWSKNAKPGRINRVLSFLRFVEVSGQKRLLKLSAAR